MKGSTLERDTLKTTIALLALSALPPAALAPTSAAAQSATQTPIAQLRELSAVEAERLAAIEAETARNGPLSPDLYQLYFALATHYDERNDPVLAAEALEQAMHIQRVNHGLFSMEQAAAIRKLIESTVAAGDIERAAQLDVQLMRIARENLDDVRSADILSEAADRQMRIYERYLAGELPPVVSINIGYTNVEYGAAGPQRYSDPNEQLGRSNLRNARRNWFTAVNVLLAAGLDSDPRIVELETRLVDSYFVEAREINEKSMARHIRAVRASYDAGRLEGLFRRGRASYQRMLAYAARNDDTQVAATAMIGLADWHLLFEKNGTALNLYIEAYQALVALGVAEEALAEIFSPDVPVVLPAFDPNPFAQAAPATQDQPDGTSYLHVKMVMSRYGRSRLRNLSISPQPHEERIEDRIRHIVARSRFRPLLIQGEAQDTAEFEFRYYYGDANDT